MPSRSQYQDLSESPQVNIDPGVPLVHVALPGDRWSHINNLDEFFRRCYQYHQRGGFICMVLQDIFEIFQFCFVILLATFLTSCIDYPVLFRDRLPSSWIATRNKTSPTIPPSYVKVRLKDVVVSNCMAKLSLTVIACLLITAFFLVFLCARALYRAAQYYEIRKFYIGALFIETNELPNMTWHEVQKRLIEVQREHQLCIQKNELSSLDIYQRILRYKSYIIALVNKEVLPPRFETPLGSVVVFTNSFKFNLELLLFWNPWGPWENYWNLRSDYKQRDKLDKLNAEMYRSILWLGVVNLVLSPLIFLWQLLYSIFQYTELIKQDPSLLGSRRWSVYGRYFLRHYNELDHELEMRLNRAHRPATAYLELFVTPLSEIIARNLMFFAGSVLAALLFLTAWDEDVIQVEHMITLMTFLGITFAICRAFLPDENLVYQPETLLTMVLAQICYMPDHWRNNAHKQRTRLEFTQFFQYRAIFLLEEMLSPIVTPLLLLFWVRPRAATLVDFFHKFTIQVAGLGDVCSFAQMDINRHGNPKWQPSSLSNKSQPPQHPSSDHQAGYGKTEMSLMHFTQLNPYWEPENPSNRQFLEAFWSKANQDVQSLAMQQQDVLDNALFQSLCTLGSVPAFYRGSGAAPFAPLGSGRAVAQHMGGRMSTIHDHDENDEAGVGTSSSAEASPAKSRRCDNDPALSRSVKFKGRGVRKFEGNLLESGCRDGRLQNCSLLSSLSEHGIASSLGLPPLQPVTASMNMQASSGTVAMENSYGLGNMNLANEMSLNVLYLHELHSRRTKSKLYGATGHRYPPNSNDSIVDLWSVPLQNREMESMAMRNDNTHGDTGTIGVGIVSPPLPSLFSGNIPVPNDDDEDEDEGPPIIFEPV